MKNRFLLLGLLAVLAASCIKEQAETVQMITDDQVFYATIEEPGNPVTRVFADSQLRVLWNADDRVSIFNKSTYNRQYRFDGQDGDNSGSFKVVPSDDFVTSNPLDYVYSVYPYSENTKISNDGEITVYLPAVQSYREDSFGLGANTMIAITQGDELMFKNLCGYFAIKLYGDNVSVSSITLKGNNNELLAGKATVIAQTNAAPTLQMSSAEATKELTLTCSTPVTLGSTAETAITFWFVIPPTTFTNGFTLTVTDNQNGEFVKTTSGSLEIKRNTLKRSTTLLVVPTPQDNLIQFEDEQTKRACLRFDTNGDGEISYDEAAAVKSLDQTFYGNRGLKFFDEFQYFTGITSIPNACFRDCIMLQKITLPPNLIQIGVSAFRGDYNLVSVTIPEGVTTISESAFQSCSKLPTVVLPESILTLESSVFMDCHALVTIDIPQSVSGIGDSAFLRCEKLSTIVIPAGVTYIDDYAFGSCTGLESIFVEANNPPRGSSTMFYETNNCPIYVPASSVDAYQSTPYWSGYASRIQAISNPNNKIYYTSTDGNIVTPQSTDCFGANLVSNEYVNGQGIMTFDGEVTSLGYLAFYGCSTLTFIQIPNSVTSVGQAAFYNCSKLSSIQIPQSVASIENSSFWGCYGLTTINVDSSNSVYDSRNNCNAIIEKQSNTLILGCQNTIIPSTVKKINTYAFADCRTLDSISIPNSIECIGIQAFYGCLGLSSIQIPKSVTTIEERAFENCSFTSMSVDLGNPIYDSRNNCNAIIETRSNSLLYGCKNTVIPNTVTTIGDFAFFRADFTSIQIPNSITRIGVDAFYYCTKLKTITIPSSVNSIDFAAFYGCSGLTSVTSLPKTPPAIESSVFEYTNSCPIYVPEQSVAAYKTAEYWSGYASRIQAIPRSNNQIYYTSTDGGIVQPTFSVCSSKLLSNEYVDGEGVMTFDGEITEIKSYAFSGCSTLSSIILPNEVSSLGDGALMYCPNLTSITIPSNVTNIGSEAFYNCSRLETIYLLPVNPPTLGYAAFPYSSIIYVPRGKKNDYKTANGWSDYANQICEEDEVTQIQYTSSDNRIIEIHDDILASRIISNEYSGGKGIIKIAGEVTTIPSNTFSGCSTLTTISLPNGITHIDYSAFSDCSNMVSISIPEGVTNIGEYAFCNCNSLISVSMPNSVTYLGPYAFKNCKSLTSVKLSDSLICIEDGSFGYCSSLSSVVIPYLVTRIGDDAFYCCNDLSSVSIPEGVTSIGKWAFEACSSLSSVVIPKSVTSLGTGAFDCCSSLSRIDVKPIVPPEGGLYMFPTSKTYLIFIPAGSEDAYVNADYWKQYAMQMRVEGSSQTLVYSSTDYSKDGEVIQIQRASVGRGINIIFLGDGFLDKDMDDGGKYEMKMRAAMEQFFAYEPYTSFRNRFNVWAVKVVSKNDYYGYETSDRRLTYEKDKLFYMRTALAEEFASKVPNPYSQPLKICTVCNTEVRVARSWCFWVGDNDHVSGNCFVNQGIGPVLNHELGGHAFGLLLDEYVENNETFTNYDSLDNQFILSGIGANVDWRNDQETVRWAHFLKDSRYSQEGLGVFEGGHLFPHGIYRATENSMMRYNNCPFNAPSREQIYKNIMRYSEGEDWIYDYETFVKADEQGRREAAEVFNSSNASPMSKSSSNWKDHHHPPIIIDKDVKEIGMDKDGNVVLVY